MPLNGVSCCHASVKLALRDTCQIWLMVELFFRLRQYHVYKDIWATVYGEELPCETEAGNRVDAFAVAVMKDGTVVGHIPKKISFVCSLYLRRGGLILCPIKTLL